MTTKARKSAHKGQIISGHPSKLLALNYVFQVCRHILRKHHHCIYIKCRVKGCNLAYVSFNRVKDLNVHHWLYHPNSHYKCHQCKKTVHTPSTWRYHQYCQHPKLHKYGDCNKFFLFKSTLKQHCHRHISQRLFKCFHGGCYVSYKHLQDLSRHAAMHQQITFECDLCDKTFKQKRSVMKLYILMLNHIYAPIVTNVSSTTISYRGTRRSIIVIKVVSCPNELTDHG